MPSKEICAKEWKQRNYASMSDCIGYKKPAKTQESNTSAKEQTKKVRYDMADTHGSVTHPIKGKGKLTKKGVRRNKY